ncbi:ABC transporter [Paenarthrobacter ilicis]|uniref:ABC transporter n=1 Tax=Paenarthrobacter ilicis TaxID=43665 RepID=UPI0038700A70
MKLRIPAAALALLFLTACAGTDAPQTAPQTAAGQDSPAPSGTGHGAVAGAAEVAEPQLHLVSIDTQGKASMLDLLTGKDSLLGTVDPPGSVSTDGRYVFAANSTGVDVVDSGAWTWDHVDHFHYYRAEAKNIGKVAGSGTATVATGMLSTAGTTGIFFPGSGEAVLLDNQALSTGEISEKLRIKTPPHQGLIAPLGEGAVVTESNSAGQPARVRALDAGGKELASADCPAAAGTITTRVGVVVGCADGAVIATTDGSTPVLEKVAYPEGAAAPATTFNGRKGRPTVAGLGSDAGVWLLNTRQRTWDWLPTQVPVLAAAAVDDAEHHVVVVGADGTVQVYDAGTKQPASVTKPLLKSTLADPAMKGAVDVTVDAQRAYVNAPAEGVVHEIDYADDARVARTLTLPTQPVHLMETGR